MENNNLTRISDKVLKIGNFGDMIIIHKFYSSTQYYLIQHRQGSTVQPKQGKPFRNRKSTTKLVRSHVVERGMEGRGNSGVGGGGGGGIL
jgi:hypothetical protein